MASVAVVVVSANSRAHIRATLDAIARQTVRPRRTIVVDNASSDGSVDEIARDYPHVELVRLEDNVGFAAANNLGARLAGDCEWIATLNPDAFPAEDWLETLLAAAAAEPDFACFGSRLVLAGDDSLLDGTGDRYHVNGFAWRRDHGSAAATVRESSEIFSPSAAAALYRRDAFLAAGGFDEAFFCYFEDTDLAFRLRLLGHRCLYVDGAVALHVGSASTGRLSDFTLFHQYRNLAWTYAKDMPWPLLLAYLPQHVLFQLLLLGWGVRRRRARVVVRAQWAALRGLPAVLRRRRAVQRRRVVGARELRRSMARGASVYAVAAGRSQRLART